MASSGYITLPCDHRECMCSLCTCGGHRCPGIYKVAPLGGSSHYRDTFTPKKGDRGEVAGGKAPPLSIKAGPNHFLTTQQLAQAPVAKAPWERVTAYKPKATVPAAAIFDGRTTHKVDFPGHQPSLPPRPPVQVGLPKVPGTYNTTLGEMQSPVAQAVRNGTALPAESAAQKPKPIPPSTFIGSTTYTAEFPAKQSEPNKPFAQRTGSANVRENRDFQTTKTASYLAPARSPRPPCPAAAAPLRPPSTDGHIKIYR